MGYATQEKDKVASPQYPNFEEALKAYQEEVKQLQAEKIALNQNIARINADLGDLLASKSKLELDCAALKKNADDLGEQIRREVLQAKEEIEGKRSVLAEDVRKQYRELTEAQDALRKGQSELHVSRQELAQKELDLGKRSAHIANAEANLAAEQGNSKELAEKTQRLNTRALNLEADLMKKDAALKLVSEELAAEAERQKAQAAKLKQSGLDLDVISKDLEERLGKVVSLESEKRAFAKTKTDFETARDLLVEKQATFEAARDRLAVREMAVAEAESQMKNWENDLKQREQLLAEKHKEK
jgi:chromosome segregation ATPase